MNYASKALESYILSHSKPEDDLLRKLRRETHVKVLLPQMISAPVQGKILTMLSCMIQPKRILEIGTFTGYSAICLARGLRPKGRLHSIDINDELGAMVNSYVKQSGFNDRIILHYGDALSVIPEIKESFDLVFIDADKVNYINYYDMVFDRVRPGGYILADNVLWSGKVVEETKDKDTRAIDAFNKKVLDDQRVENFILGVSDGLMIARKIER